MKITMLNGKTYEKAGLIESARDDDFYYGFLGKNALSSSSVSSLLESPQAYLDSITAKQKDVAAFLIGGAIHVSLLEEERLHKLYTHVGVASRNTNAYKEMKQSEERKVLTKPEWDLMEKVQGKLQNLEEFKYRRELSITEVPAIGEIFGVPFRAKADMLDNINGCVYDLKTTSSIKDFKRSAYKYNYDSQAYIYCKLFGVSYDRFEFLVVDKKTLEFGVFTVSEEAYLRGEQKVKKAIEIYQNFFLNKTQEETQKEIEKFIIYDTI